MHRACLHEPGWAEGRFGGQGLAAFQVHGARGQRLAAWLALPHTACASRPAPLVVAVHGWGANGATLAPMVAPLMRAGIAVRLFDAASHGNSSGEAFSSLPRFAKDLAAVLDTLRGNPAIDAGRCANMNDMNIARITNELDFLQSLVPLAHAHIIEAGCGAAHLARELVSRHPTAEVVGVEVDECQLAKNLLTPTARLRFENAGAQAMPFPDASFNGALMLKSLHHVPIALMDQALAEMARVLRDDGWLYVSEPVYAGELNELIRLFNDEGQVRAAAQAALDRALDSGRWSSAADLRFESPVHFSSFDAFEQRMMRPTFADHGIDAAMIERVRSRFMPHLAADGAHFTRPMHVRLLRKTR